MAIETCENCGKPIGKLETPFVWQDHAVCAECMLKLGGGQPNIPPPQEYSIRQSDRHALSGPALMAMGGLAGAVGEFVSWLIWQFGVKHSPWPFPDVPQQAMAWATASSWIGWSVCSVIVLAGAIRWGVFAERSPSPPPMPLSGIGRGVDSDDGSPRSFRASPFLIFIVIVIVVMFFFLLSL